MRALRAGAGQPADRHLHDEPPGGAEHHPARSSLHQPGARAAPRRLRSRPGRLHHDHARSAQDRAQRSALLRAGRHHGRLPFGRRLREPRRLFRLGRRARASSCPTARGYLAAAGRFAMAARRRSPQSFRRNSRIRRGSPSAACPICAAACRQAVVPASRLLPAASAVHRLGALQRDVPAGGHAEGRARRVAGGRGQAERAARLLCQQHQAGELLPGRQGARLGDDRGRGGADARDLLRPDERDRRSSRPRLRLPEGDRPVGRHADRLHLRSWRAARRPSSAGQDRLLRRVLPHPA